MQVSMKNLWRLAVLAIGATLLLMSTPAVETPREITEQEAALHKAAVEHDYDRAIQLARSARALEFLGPGGTTVLCEAAYDSSADGYDLVSELLKLGAKPNARCGPKQAETPLYFAALAGNLAVVDLLIKYGAEINPEVELETYRPIYGAYMRNDKRVIERLEQYGAAIPRKHRENLRRGQALRDIMVSLAVEEIPDGMDVEEWEARQALKFYDAFRESHTDTPDIVAWLDAMAEYRRNNPRPKEMGADEWQALQIQAAADQVYGPQGAFNPDGTKR